MSAFQNVSIRRKQTLIIMLTSSVVLFLACASFITLDTVTFRRELSERVTILADAVGSNCAAAIDFEDVKAAQEALTALRADDNIVAACVYSSGGRIFAAYKRDAAAPFAFPIARPDGHEFRADQLQVFRSIEQAGAKTGTIFVASDLRDISTRLKRYMSIVGLVFLTSLLIALALSSRLQRLVSDPILLLARWPASVALEKNYSVRAVKTEQRRIRPVGRRVQRNANGQIQTRDTALQAAREGLETRVAERTTELAKSNQDLQAEISERQRIAEKLLVQATALDAAANAIAITDGTGTIEWVNRAFTTLTGYTSEEAVGQNPRILKSDKQDDAFYRNLWQTISSGQVWNGELTNRRKDGSLYSEEMTITPLRNAEGVIARYIAVKRDITERKRAEELLRASQLLIEGIINAIPVRVFWKDKNLVYLGCNAACARDAGFADPKDIIGKDDYQMAWRDRAEQYRGDDRQVIESGCAKLLIEEPLTTPEGNIVTILTSKVPLRSSTGEISGVIGTFMDITERKRADDLFRLSEERFRIAAETANDVIYEWDLKQSLEWLGKIDDLLGYEPGEFPRTMDGFAAAVHPEDLERTMAAIQAHLEGRGPYAIEYRVRRKDGVYRWWSARGAVARTPEGKPTRWIGSITDITERKETEIALMKLAAIVESSNDAIIGKDLNGIIVNWNKGAEKLFGYTASEMTGTSVLRLIPADKQEEENQILKRIKRRESVESFETVRQAKDGRLIDVAITASPIKDPTGQIIGVSKVARDITERKQTEAERNRLAAILEATTDLVSFSDPAGKVLYYNRAGRKLLGIGLDEDVTKMSVADCIPNPSSNIILTEGVPTAIRQGIWSGETFLLSRSGQEIPVSQVILAHKSRRRKA